MPSRHLVRLQGVTRNHRRSHYAAIVDRTAASGIGNSCTVTSNADVYVSVTKTKQVVKVISQKDRIAAAHGRFSRIREVAPMCTPYIESQSGCMATSL